VLPSSAVSVRIRGFWRQTGKRTWVFLKRPSGTSSLITACPTVTYTSLNVAITRAKELLVVIGNAELLKVGRSDLDLDEDEN